METKIIVPTAEASLSSIADTLLDIEESLLRIAWLLGTQIDPEGTRLLDSDN